MLWEWFFGLVGVVSGEIKIVYIISSIDIFFYRSFVSY